MAENKSFTVDLSGLSNFTMSEGIGSSSLLKMDGYYALTIAKVTQGQSSTGNNKFILSCAVQDADEKGQSLIADVLASGTTQKGDLNIVKHPMGLGRLLASLGMTQEQVQRYAANGTQPGDAMAAAFTGKTVYVNVEAETYNGNTRSRCQNFITKQQYEDAVAANAHRKVRKADQTFAAAPAGVTTGPTTVAAPAAAPAPSNGVDPLAKLKALNLPI